MNSIDQIVEQKISEAIERGELSGLPGEGAPLELENDALVPQELRMAYRVLFNAGFVPPEVSALREISDLERRVEELTQVDERVGALRKLQYLRARLEASGRFRHVFLSTSTYSAKLLARLQSGSKAHGEKRLTPKNEPFVENAGTAQRPLKAQP